MGVQTWEAGLPDSSLSILCKLNHHFTTVSFNFQVCKVGIMTPTSLVCTQPNIVPGTEQVPSPLQAFTFISQWSLKQRTCRAIFEGVGKLKLYDDFIQRERDREQEISKTGREHPSEPWLWRQRQDRWAFLCVHSTEYFTASLDKQAVIHHTTFYQLKQLGEKITLRVWILSAAGA